jgi:ParB-like chromosome segregation protein Spo0J
LRPGPEARNPEDVSLLLISMKRVGLLEPVTVYQDDNGDWIVHDGARRIEAAAQLGWTELRVRVITKPADPIRDALVRNNVRRGQEPGARAADCLADLIAQGRNRREVAREYAISPGTVARLVSLRNKMIKAKKWEAAQAENWSIARMRQECDDTPPAPLDEVSDGTPQRWGPEVIRVSKKQQEVLAAVGMTAQEVFDSTITEVSKSLKKGD